MSDATPALQALFASTDVEEVLWQEQIDNVAPAGATLVDVVLTCRRTGITSASWRIGLTYLPAGPVVKGVQSIAEGQSLVFKNVPVKRGAILALATEVGWAGDRPAISVSVEPVGQGAAKAKEVAPELTPIAEVSGLVTGLAVLAGVLLTAYVVTKWG